MNQNNIIIENFNPIAQQIMASQMSNNSGGSNNPLSGDTIDICGNIADIINNQLNEGLSIPINYAVDGLNIALKGFRQGMIYTTEGVDFVIESLSKSMNSAVDGINKSRELFKPFFELIKTFFSGKFFDLIKTLIGFILIIVLPTSQIPYLSTYMTFGLYIFIIVMFAFPLIQIIYLILSI